MKNGKRADLIDADLRNADLMGADLRGADLIDADLRNADLMGADLRGADLMGADLRNADLRSADLRNADLRSADLMGADLRGADLSGADLRDADLSGADLRDADLRNAYLRGTDLRGTTLPHFQIVPSVGSFIAWKKTTLGVIQIEIPEDAERTSSLVGRKCRASKVIVLGGDGSGGKSPTYGKCIYEIGATIAADRYDPDIRVECTHGIHFFMTEQEARKW
jgi:uncharacterized protein YjbI with pentapeptide repeats